MLLEKLIAKQKALQLNDSEFAAELGISRALWQGTRTKRFRVSESVIRGARKRFPEMIPEILFILGDDANKNANFAS